MFDRLAGNDRIKKVLADMLTSGRLVHSFIIEGDEGTGRHTLASIIASAAVCAGVNKPCGMCRPCLAAEELNHPDISVYAPTKSKFSVETVREIRRESHIMPIELSRRIFVLENADLMTAEAANALLKVLEEPPGTVMFMLLVKSAASLPVTIRSRCVILSLTEPGFDEGFRLLRMRYSALPEDDIKNALASSANNIGRADAILKGDTDGNLLDAARKCINLLLNSDRLGLLKAFLEFEKKQSSALALLTEIRSLLVQALPEVCRGKIADFSETEILCVVELIDKATSELYSNCNTSLVMTVTASRLFALLSSTGLERP